MGRILTALFLFFLTSVALAQSSLTQTASFAATLTPPETDRSVAYLGLIFGTVGNTIQGTGGQILGQMFAVFNKGVMVVAALYLAMTTGQMAMRAAQEGSFMGQNKSVHLVLLRIALGFALIIPSSSTGYSLLQDFFMKVVVAGVALADETWNAALNYMTYGGQLYIPPTTLNQLPGSTIVSTFVGTLPANYGQGNTLAPLTGGVATQIFQDEVCMIRSSGRAWNSGNQIQDTFDFQSDPANGIIYFPGHGGGTVDATNPSGNAVCGSVASYCAQSSNPCGVPVTGGGSVSLPTYNGSVDTTSGVGGVANYEMEWHDSWIAMRQLVISLMPAAENYVNNYSFYTESSPGANTYSPAAGSSDDTAVITSNAKTFLTAVLAYGNLMAPVQNLKNGNGLNLGEEASHGWIMAGGFYWDVEQANKGASGVGAATLVPTATPPTGSSLPSSGGVNGVTEMVTLGNEVIGGSGYTGYGNQVATLWSQYTGAANSGAAQSALNNFNSGGLAAEILMAILSAAGGDMGFSLGGAMFTSGDSYNPIAVLMHMGDGLVESVAGMWTSALVLSIVLAIPAGICNSTQPAGLVLKAALTWIKSIMMMLTTALMVPGAILAYYVPMYPFAVYTFAVVGWLMLVVEGMAAAPLICVGITHPEGHDFLGKGEQALMFFLAIFVRPALLIIGLIASMLVSFVAFQIFMAGFYHLNKATPTLYTIGLSEIFMLLINWIMGLVIFGGFTIEIIEQSYKLTYQLPQYVMKWIGGPEMGQDYGQMASQLKGTVSSGAGGIDKGMASGVKATAKLGKDLDKASAKAKGGTVGGKTK